MTEVEEATVFDDVHLALEEAEFLANQTGWPHSLVLKDGMIHVMKKHQATGLAVLETVRPTE